MWMSKYVILLCGLGAIHAQITYFNSSSKNTTLGNQLNITCNAYLLATDYLYIVRNGDRICSFRKNFDSIMCDRDRGDSRDYPYKMIISRDREYYSCCANSSIGSGVSIMFKIKETRKEDNGTWACIQANYNKTLPVVVKYPPSINNITIEPIEEEIKEGSNVKLSCLVDSFPKSNITWTLNGELDNNQRQDLEIKSVTCQDSGRYVASCSAQNGVGNSKMKEKIVNVYCPPRVNPRQIPQTQMIASLEDSVTLTATVMAYPAPTFTWKYLLKDKLEKYITDYRMKQANSVDNLTSSMQINNIQEFDYGNFIMFASNEMGNTSVTFTLKKAGDNKLGTGIGIGFIVGLLISGVILAVVFFIWKKRGGKGLNLKQMFQVQKKSSRRTSSEDAAPTTRKPSTSKTTTVTFVKSQDETYEGLDSTQPRVEQTYEGLLPGNPVKIAYEEQEIYENQVVR